MTQATAIPMPQSPPADQLAGAVLRSLDRPSRAQFSMSPVRAMVLGGLTFGFWPLWKMRGQFRDFTIHERQQLWHVAEWIRTRIGGDDAVELQQAAERIRFRESFSTVAWCCALLVALVLLMSMNGDLNWDRLLARTYSFTGSSGFARQRSLAAFFAWNFFLSLGYLLHALQVRLHHADVRRWLMRLNAICARQGIGIWPQIPIERGHSFLWIVGAVVLSLCGAIWSVSLAIAGVAQRNYVNITARHQRVELQRIVRSLLASHRATDAPAFVVPGRRCANHLCQAPFRVDAQFCPRCGSAAVMSGVA